MNNSNKTFKKLRCEFGLTQQMVADGAAVSRYTVMRYEKGISLSLLSQEKIKRYMDKVQVLSEESINHLVNIIEKKIS